MALEAAAKPVAEDEADKWVALWQACSQQPYEGRHACMCGAHFQHLHLSHMRRTPAPDTILQIAIYCTLTHLSIPAAGCCLPACPRRSPLREIIFAVRSICPLVAALLLLVKLVLRVPLPKISFWVQEEEDLGGAAEEQQGADQALYTAASGGSSMMIRRTASDADTDASVSVRQGEGDGSSRGGARAADGDGGGGDMAGLRGSLDLDAVERGGGASGAAAGGGSGDDASVTDSRAASPVAVSGKAGGAAVVKEAAPAAGAEDSSAGGDWVPLLIGFGMCQVGWSATYATVCSCLAWNGKH